jgi:hypothetical protein
LGNSHSRLQRWQRGKAHTCPENTWESQRLTQILRTSSARCRRSGFGRLPKMAHLRCRSVPDGAQLQDVHPAIARQLVTGIEPTTRCDNSSLRPVNPARRSRGKGGQKEDGLDVTSLRWHSWVRRSLARQTVSNYHALRFIYTCYQVCTMET